MNQRHAMIVFVDEENVNSCSGEFGFGIAIKTDEDGTCVSNAVISERLTVEEAAALVWLTISYMIDEHPEASMGALREISDIRDVEITDYFRETEAIT